MVHKSELIFRGSFQVGFRLREVEQKERSLLFWGRGGVWGFVCNLTRMRCVLTRRVLHLKRSEGFRTCYTQKVAFRQCALSKINKGELM